MVVWECEHGDHAGHRRQEAVNLALATWVSAINFWAWNLIGPLSTTYARRSVAEQHRGLDAGRHADPGRIAGPHRQSARSPTGSAAARCSSSCPLASIVPVLAVGVAGTQRFLSAAAGVRLLPRHRRNDLRGRHPVRQQLVRARPARLRDRRVRRGHGRHRAVGVLHAAVRALVRAVHRRTSSSRSRWR